MTVDEAMRILRHGWSDESRAMAAQVVDGHIATQAAQIEALTKDAARFRHVESTARAEGRDGGWSGVWVLPIFQAWNDSPNPAFSIGRQTLAEAIDSAIKAKETKA